MFFIMNYYFQIMHLMIFHDNINFFEFLLNNNMLNLFFHIYAIHLLNFYDTMNITVQFVKFLIRINILEIK